MRQDACIHGEGPGTDASDTQAEKARHGCIRRMLQIRQDEQQTQIPGVNVSKPECIPHSHCFQKMQMRRLYFERKHASYNSHSPTGPTSPHNRVRRDSDAARRPAQGSGPTSPHNRATLQQQTLRLPMLARSFSAGGQSIAT